MLQPERNPWTLLLQPIKDRLNWWFWCGHEALSTLPFWCTRTHSPFKSLTNPRRCAHYLWQLTRVPAGFGWRLRMSTEVWVASTDVCDICEGVWIKKTSLRLWNGDLDGFRRIFVDSDGVRRILAGFCGTPRFSGGCVQMPAQLL